MTIKEVEEKTGLSRSHIRFYEKEGLVVPERNGINGYREYTEKNVQDIQRIAYLRTLGVSIEEIQRVMQKKLPLRTLIKRQAEALKKQAYDLEQARTVCEKMLLDEELSFEKLDVKQYVPDLRSHWKEYRDILEVDSVRFFTKWGDMTVWMVLTGICILIPLLFYGKLPKEIPIQWGGGVVRASAGKWVLFLYPAACVMIRFFLRPFILRWLSMRGMGGSRMAGYITNYLCFLALSIEIFTILYVYGIMKNIVLVLAADTILLGGILAAGGKAWRT